MNQDFKLKFDEMRENDPTGENGEQANERFASTGHVRNLCFVWPDGKKKFLNYAYLVSCDYDPDENTITLNFTSDTVLIKGSGLDGVFEELFSHIPKRIVCVDVRYNSVANGGSIINDITLISK